MTLLVLVPTALSGLSSSFSNPLLAVPAIFLAHWSLLLLFTGLYRVSPFHPLAKFPGPFFHKISKFKDISEKSKGTMHQYYQKLHQKYGDFVRIGKLTWCDFIILISFTGPNELSYCHVDGVTETLSARGLPKGPFNYASVCGASRLLKVWFRLRRPGDEIFGHGHRHSARST